MAAGFRKAVRRLLLSVAPLLVAAQAQPEEAAFHFAWKPGMNCEVTREVTSANDPRFAEAKIVWSIHVSALGKDRLLVATEDMAIVPRDANRAISEADRARGKMVGVLGNLSFSVNRAGEFQAVENFAEIQRNLRALEKDPGIDRWELDEFMKLFTLERAQQGARTEWEKLLGSWHDLPLEPGVPVKVALSAPLPQAPDTAVSIPAFYKLEASLPCERKPTVRCATVVSAQTPSDEEMAKLVAGADGNMPMNGFAIHGYKRVSKVVFEADSLIPHLFSERTQAQVSGTFDAQSIETTFDRSIVDTYTCN